MSDTRGLVVFDLAGRTIRARATFVAALEIERTLGVGVGALSQRLARSSLGMTETARVIYECALAAYDPRRDGSAPPTLDEIGSLLLQAGLLSALDGYGRLLATFLRGPREVDDDEGKSTAPVMPATGASPSASTSGSPAPFSESSPLPSGT